MAIEHLRTWQIGNVEVTRVVEIWDMQDDIRMTIPDATSQELDHYPWLRPHFVTPDVRQRLNFQGFLLRLPGRTIMIDTCIGNDRRRPYPVFSDLRTSFLADLAALGVHPEAVDTVLCTHLHQDHVGWNTRLVDGRWVPTFPNARYLFGREEKEGWDRIRAEGHHDVGHLDDAVEPILMAGLADLVEVDHRLCEEVRLAASRGHTPGHVHVLIDSGGERAVITADVMHHPLQCALPHRPATFDMDRAQGIASRTAFVETFCDSGVLVIGSHFAEPTAGWIRRDSKGGVYFDTKLDQAL